MDFVRFVDCPTCLAYAFVVYINVHTGDPNTAVNAEGHCLECGQAAPVHLIRCPNCKAHGAIQAGEGLGATCNCPKGCAFPVISRTELAQLASQKA